MKKLWLVPLLGGLLLTGSAGAGSEVRSASETLRNAGACLHVQGLSTDAVGILLAANGIVERPPKDCQVIECPPEALPGSCERVCSGVPNVPHMTQYVIWA